MCNLINIHTYIHTPWEDQREWHRMTRMTRPDCAVMCNLINIHTYIHTYIHIIVYFVCDSASELERWTLLPFWGFPALTCFLFSELVIFRNLLHICRKC